MKKLYFLLFVAALSLKTSLIAQTSLIKAPALTTTTSTQVGPNGTSQHATFRGCFLVRASELTVIGTNTAINTLGFFLNSGSGTAVNGTMIVHIQNTNDASYLKGTNYTTAIATMTQAYNNTFVIPATFGSTIINMTFTTPVTYTGGGLYVAYDWVTTGPFGGSQSVFQSDNTLAAAGAVNSTTVSPASNVLAPAGIRPCFQIGYINSYTNEAQAYGVLGNARQPLINGAPYSFSVIVRNNAGIAMTNITPTITLTGANTFSATTTIASLAAGATVIATFPAYTATTQGMSTVAIALPTDENNANNTISMTHSVTCNYLNSAINAPLSSFTQGVGLNGGGLLLSRFNAPATSSITALKLGIANYGPNTGNAVYGVLTNASGVILATTNTITISNLMFGTYQIFSFATPVNLTGGTDYYMGLAQPNNVVPYFPVASMPTPSNNIPSNLYATSFIGGGFIGVQTPTLGWFAMEGIFYNTISVTVTPATSTICSGNTLTLTASGATSYSWSNGVSTATNAVTPGVYSVYTATGSAVVSTVGVCENVQSSNVFVNLTPVISQTNGAICPVGGSFTLNPSGAASYTYSGGSNVVTPSVTSSYTIDGISGAGCPALPLVVTVSVLPTLSVSIAGPSVICNGDAVSLTASGAVTYSWNLGSPSNIVVISPSTTTTYSVTGIFGTCTNTAMKTVSVTPQLTVTAYATPTSICIGNTGTLIAFGSVGAGSTSYSWSTGQTTQTINVTPTITTQYTVSGVSNGVCSSETVVTLVVDPCVGIKENTNSSAQISIYPNPNNGVFTLFVSSVTDNSVIEVYNAIGQVSAKQKLSDTYTSLNLSALAKGIYILKLKENNQAVKTARIVIQ